MSRRLTRGQTIRLLSDRLRGTGLDSYEFHYLLRDLMELSGWGRPLKDVPTMDNRRRKIELEVEAIEARRQSG